MSDITKWFGPNTRLKVTPTHVKIKCPRRGEPESLGEGSPPGTLEEVRDKILEIGSVKGLQPIAVSVSFTDDNLLKYNEFYLLNKLEKVLNGTKNVIQYCMVVDYSKVGRFHLHGILTLNDVLKSQYLKNKITKECGNVKFKPCDNVLGWAEYCLKMYTAEGKKGVFDKPKHMRCLSSH